ncbi:MAG: type II toxin-antitoxin system VapC family toxin [Deltaproteobacteria bacterium]|nr:type II toxin-antitoxin system VapC family toxin [Deltaproteobacteria bacterium]
MRYLLDTHAIVWSLAEPKKLSKKARAIVEGDADAVVSAASVWELAIKMSNDRLTLPVELSVFIDDVARDLGVTWLAIEVAHALRVRALPWHHRDPFDRLLAAQAIAEDLTIVSPDAIFERYGCKRAW